MSAFYFLYFIFSSSPNPKFPTIIKIKEERKQKREKQVKCLSDSGKRSSLYI